jgi:hypothetical protein
MTASPKYWFPAKRYGWGWGLPRVWQGWLVIVTFAVLVLGGAIILLPKYGPIAFVSYSAVLCAVLVVICRIKGEPPTWRS